MTLSQRLARWLWRRDAILAQTWADGYNACLAHSDALRAERDYYKAALAQLLDERPPQTKQERLRVH
jgi:hypothetical protein